MNLNALFDTNDSYVLGSEIQGQLLDPLGGFQRLRFNDLVTKPFLDGALSYGETEGNRAGEAGRLVLTGFTVAPLPIGFYLEASEVTDKIRGRNYTSFLESFFEDREFYEFDGLTTSRNLEFRFGANLTPRLGILGLYKTTEGTVRYQSDISGPFVVPEEFAFFFGGSAQGAIDALPGLIPEPEVVTDQITFQTPDVIETFNETTQGVGLSYRLRERAVLSFLAVSEEATRRATQGEITNVYGLRFLRGIEGEEKRTRDFLGLGFRSDDARGVWFAGYETYDAPTENDIYSFQRFPVFPDALEELKEETGFDPFAPSLVSGFREKDRVTQFYIQRRQNFGGPFDISAELGLHFHDHHNKYTGIDIDGDPFVVNDESRKTFAPRLGFGASILPGHRIRVAHIRDVDMGAISLSPSTVLGLYPIAVNQFPGAETRANIFRYDGTFGKRFHLSLEHQSLEYSNANFGRDIASEDLNSVRFDRTELRAEAWLGRGVGAFASMVWLDNEVAGARDAALPGVPDREASLGVTWVHPSRFRASARARYAGERVGFAVGETLDPVWTVDASMSWESRDKRIQLSASGTNLFDANVQRSFGLGREERSLSVNAEIRF